MTLRGRYSYGSRNPSLQLQNPKGSENGQVFVVTRWLIKLDLTGFDSEPWPSDERLLIVSLRRTWWSCSRALLGNDECG